MTQPNMYSFFTLCPFNISLFNFQWFDLSLQDQPAFIMKDYVCRTYLEPVSDRGRHERRRQAASDKTDFRLLPLNEYEEIYAAASHMDLVDVTSYIPHVRDFINKKKTPDQAQLPSWGHALRQHPNLHKLGERPVPLSDEELEHLTRYLLYEAEQRRISLWIDVLVVLPKQRRIIGTRKQCWARATFFSSRHRDVRHLLNHCATAPPRRFFS